MSMLPNGHRTMWITALAGVAVGLFFAFVPFSGNISQPINVTHAATECIYPGACITPDAPEGALVTPVYVTNEGLQAKLKSQVDYQLTFAAYLGVLNAATYFAQTVAYDVAEWASNGFTGQAPGIFTSNWDKYLGDLLLDSVGEFMGTFSEEFTKGAFGIDLCRPPNFPMLALEFALGLPDLAIPGLGRPRPKCSWSDIVNNWEASVQSLDNLAVWNNVKGSFSTGGNDVSFGIGANLAFFDFVAEQKASRILGRQEGQGFKSVDNFITGNIETPSQTVKRSIEHQIIENPSMTQAENQGALISTAFELGWIQLGVVTASTFTNVLLSRLLGKVFKGLFGSEGEGPRGLPDLLNPFAAGTASKRDEIFASNFRDILTPNLTSPEQQDLIAELTGCPSVGRSKWNCTIDQGIATALRQGGGLTVRQAIDLGFINENWPLIPSSNLKDNQDPECRSRAFCAGNLRKMRLSRIIPVGWEMAADSSANQLGCTQGNGCVTLSEVISKYNDCNALFGLDADHPYCHLIDPNWVLTAFPAQCITKGFTDDLLEGTGGRLQECQDTVTCLQRDDKGQCIGDYGYCMAEQTFWQFASAKCEEQYVSCRTYTPRGQNPKKVSYLRSTLDYGSCNETNVGCMWYAMKRQKPQLDLGRDPNGAWDSVTYERQDGKVYFDKTILPCDGQFDGCTELLRFEEGEPALNLVRNGSFEDITDKNISEGWEFWPLLGYTSDWTYEVPDPGSGTAAVVGGNAILPPFFDLNDVFKTGTDYGLLFQFVTGVRGVRQYTLSYYARKLSDTPDNTGVVAIFQNGIEHNPGNPNAIVYQAPTDPSYFRSDGCNAAEVLTAANIFFQPNSYAGTFVPSTLGNEWTRFECSFVTPPDAGQLLLFLVGADTNSRSALFDGIMLEESEVPGTFIDGLNTALAPVHMKIPPDELLCSGNPEKDLALCSNFAPVCRQNEAGCQGYRPKSFGSAPEVPAVLSSVDYCPNECVGYAEFRKQASTFDLVRSNISLLDDPDDDTIAHFIPSTALSCTAQEVGCEAFTNLEAVSGPSEFGFSYLRSCEKPSSDSETFYTWEGSDETGFQLRSWSLIKDVTLPAGKQGPKILIKAGPDGRIKDPAECNQRNFLTAQDPDCRQFYDPTGSVYYRYESQTIISDIACTRMRKDASSRADCEKTGGGFDPSTNQCIYLAMPEQSNQCDIAFSGCRAYIGTQGNAQEEVYNEDFLSETHSVTAGSNTTISLSDESVLVGDQSLRIDVTTGQTGSLSFDVPTLPGVLYELSFWAKEARADRPTIVVRRGTSTSVPAVGSATLRAQWTVYRIGPFEGEQGTDKTTLTMSGFPKLSFIDKIRVERVQDVAYVVKDSWNTPAMCDQTSEGIPQPQAMLGCRTYIDREEKEVNVRQFTRLCRETAIGCKAYINTRNSDNPYYELFSRPSVRNAFLPEVTVRGGDRWDYFIEDQSKFCPEAFKGCRAFGLPNFRQDRLVLDNDDTGGSFKTVYLMDDVTKYEEGICSEAELFCEEYKYEAAKESGVSYFRAPADHVCEYRKSAVVDPSVVLANGVSSQGTTFDGWFRVGTDIPCYPEFLKRGSEFGIKLTGDPGFNPWVGAPYSLYPNNEGVRAWTGLCSETRAECTELRDVGDKSDILHPLGKPYFVVRDNQFDTESCNGQVDPGRGCVLFRDTSDARLLYSSQATYGEYTARGYEAVDPIDCEATPNRPSCLGRRSCKIEVSSNNPIALIFRNQLNEARTDCTWPGTESTCTDQQNWLNAFLGVGASWTSTCEPVPPPSDTNLVVKVKPDRACSQWLSCQSSETVFDPQSGRYKSICSDLALCNKAETAEGSDIPFCASFVDRDSVYSPFFTRLNKSIVLTDQWYSVRPTGFGTVDYSGMSLPDHYQVMDTKLVPLGSMLSPDPRVRSRFKKDYRLAVPLLVGIESDLRPARLLSADEKQQLAGSPQLAPYACLAKQTGAFGLLTDTAKNLVIAVAGASTDNLLCWVSLDQTRPPQLVGGGDIVADNLNAVSLMLRLSQGENPNADQVLNRSFPNATCKAAPETDSPFGNEFVLEWDDSVTPPIARRVVPGYSRVQLCEFGENCACSYKRASFGQMVKFYEPLSTNVLNAVCVGGPRDSLPCIVNQGITGAEIEQPAAPAEEPAAGAEPPPTPEGPGASHADVDDTACGESGVCTVLSGVDLIRGIVGQCLQYDVTRTLPGGAESNACLVWSPMPVLSGPGDQYHWSVTAGYQPPQTSGRYYCSSPVRPPRQFNIRAEVVEGGGDDDQDRSHANGFGLIVNSIGTYAGAISRAYYDEAIVSDESCVDFLDIGGCDGNEGGGSLDGSRSEGTDVGEWCEDADDDNGAGDYTGGVFRLVTTGRGDTRAYAEYVYLLDRAQIAEGVAGKKPPEGADGVDMILNNTLEEVLAGIDIGVRSDMYGCGYQGNWVGVSNPEDFDDNDELKKKGGEFAAAFRAEISKSGGRIDRTNSGIVTDDGSQTGVPVIVDCIDTANQGVGTGGCYMKYWQLDFKAEGQDRFRAFGPDVGRSSLDSLSRSPVYGRCRSGHSWFSVRAVFENTNAAENGKDPEDTDPKKLTGPFQIVGLWVTACAAGGTPRYIYTNMTFATADICRELLETISKDSKDNAAFTDRNWERGSFAVPRIGYSWGTTNVPFGASLATGDAGVQPLYMSGVRQKDVNPLNPPTFTYPGQTYFRATTYPTSNWGALSNVFARIYRIYGYFVRGVSRDDWACTSPDSPNFGQWCPPLENASTEERATLSQKFCGYEAKCDTGGIGSEEAFDIKVCNSFSGTNRGLDCSGDPDVCHRAPVTENEGILQPMLAQCALYGVGVAGDGNVQAWNELGSGQFQCTGADCPADCVGEEGAGCSRAEAIRGGAFRCSGGSVRDPAAVKGKAGGSTTYASYCTRESQNSSECPQRITGIACGSDDTCEGFPWAECTEDRHCQFDARHWWPAGNANLTWKTASEPGFFNTPTYNLGLYTARLNREIDPVAPSVQTMFYGYSESITITVPKSHASAAIDAQTGQAMFAPAVANEAYAPFEATGAEVTPFFATPILPSDLFTSLLVDQDANDSKTSGDGITASGLWNDLDVMALFPGFNPLIFGASLFSGAGNPGCSPNFDSGFGFFSLACGEGDTFIAGHALTIEYLEELPFYSFTPNELGPPPARSDLEELLDRLFGAEETVDRMRAQYGACESLTLMYQHGEATAPTIGTCRGGVRSGSICRSDDECRPQSLSQPEYDVRQESAKYWCNPVTSGGNNENAADNYRMIAGDGFCSPAASCTPDYLADPQNAYIDDGIFRSYGWKTTGGDNAACWPNGDNPDDTNHPRRQEDTALDTNICTHPPGYWPRPNYCKDPNDEYCGLFGYIAPNDRFNPWVNRSVNDAAPLPTDVTQGLYTPIYLNPNGSNVNGSSIDYGYLDYYNPIPPKVAAPDVRTCSGGQCRITSVGTFSIDGLAEGTVNGGSGNHVATMRFYAWAGHDQMPLRKVVVDWGDGTVTELPDGFMKNRKPYCGTEKECAFIPGLTCSSDVDCPPGGGLCEEYGTCSNNPNLRCSKDANCAVGNDPGVCLKRTFFGNDDDACEENFFEFRHAYSCLDGNRPTTDCNEAGFAAFGGHCSSDPSLICLFCAAGDKCIQNSASSRDGCFEAQTNTCRFTPRIMIVDNWGWCTGECRGAVGLSGQLIDYNFSTIRHPNGGCYDASSVKPNIPYDFPTIAGNECAQDLPVHALPSVRPWVVFPGAIQMLPGEAL